jgi:hypothetical protein
MKTPITTRFAWAMKTPIITRFAWAIVLGAGLVISAWSLYYVSRYAGMPVWAAIFTSTVFDGAALLAGHHALKSARIGESGTVPRTAMILFAGCSAYLNSRHASIAHLPAFAGVLFAMPPVVAVIVYELHTRQERNRALARTKKKLPSLGILTWLLMPIESFKAIRTIVMLRAKRTVADSQAIGNSHVIETVSDSSQVVSGSFSEFENTGPKFLIPLQVESPLSYSDARRWAKEHNYMVNDRGPLPEYVLEAYKVYLDTLGKDEGVS